MEYKYEFRRRLLYILVAFGLSGMFFPFMAVPFMILISLFLALDIRIGFIENIFIDKELDKKYKPLKVFCGGFQNE